MHRGCGLKSRDVGTSDRNLAAGQDRAGPIRGPHGTTESARRGRTYRAQARLMQIRVLVLCGPFCSSSYLPSGLLSQTPALPAATALVWSGCLAVHQAALEVIGGQQALLLSVPGQEGKHSWPWGGKGVPSPRLGRSFGGHGRM